MADVKKVIEIIDKIIADVDEQKLFLTELDNVIGDGDHGINLARGFDAVKTIEDTFESKDIGAILKAIGMKLVSTVGGASGPLYGTAFMKSGALLNGKTEMDMNDFIEMLQVSIDGIMKRGKAVKGEKLQKKVSNIQRQLLRQRVVQATLEKEVSDTRIRVLLHLH